MSTPLTRTGSSVVYVPSLCLVRHPVTALAMTLPPFIVTCVGHDAEPGVPSPPPPAPTGGNTVARIGGDPLLSWTIQPPPSGPAPIWGLNAAPSVDPSTSRGRNVLPSVDTRRMNWPLLLAFQTLWTLPPASS